MWAALSYILVFFLCWWAISFVIGGIASLPTYKLFGYDVFDAPTPAPIITVAIVGFIATYQFLLLGFDMHPPFGNNPERNGLATANVPAQPSSNQGALSPSRTSNSDRESRILFWVGLALSLPIGVVSSLLASWIHSQVKRT